MYTKRTRRAPPPCTASRILARWFVPATCYKNKGTFGCLCFWARRDNKNAPTEAMPPSQTGATILRMKFRVYVESSIISYLVARPSRDLVVAAHQQVTQDWWNQSGTFELCISNYVVAEISSGDVALARSRIERTSGATMLKTSIDVEQLADRLIDEKCVPSKARLDSLHIAVCAIHSIEYLLTWNCKHIANAQTMRLIENCCAAAGYQCPRLCTPLELMES